MVDLDFENRTEILPTGAELVVTVLHGAIDATTVRRFEETIGAFYDQGIHHVVLDFGDLKYINSTGMGLMVKLMDRFSEVNGTIQLANVPKKIADLFEMLGLLSIFRVYGNAGEAVADMRGGAPAPYASPPEEEEIPEAEAIPEAEPISEEEMPVAPALPSSSRGRIPSPLPPSPLPAAARSTKPEEEDLPEWNADSSWEEAEDVLEAGPLEEAGSVEEAEAVEEVEPLDESDSWGAPVEEAPVLSSDWEERPTELPPSEEPEELDAGDEPQTLEVSPMEGSVSFTEGFEAMGSSDAVEAVEVAEDDSFAMEGFEDAAVAELEEEPPSSDEAEAIPAAPPRRTPAPAARTPTPPPRSASPSGRTTVSAAEFPLDHECAFCNGVVEIPGAGHFQCPRCGNLLEIDARGGVQDYHELNPRVVEIKVPCEREFLANFKALASSMAKRIHLGEDERFDLNLALEQICEIIAEKRPDHSETFQAVVVGNKDQLAIGIKTSSGAFGAANGRTSDRRLKEIAKHLDLLELVPLSTRGELLKLVKRAKRR